MLHLERALGSLPPSDLAPPDALEEMAETGNEYRASSDGKTSNEYLASSDGKTSNEYFGSNDGMNSNEHLASSDEKTSEVHLGSNDGMLADERVVSAGRTRRGRTKPSSSKSLVAGTVGLSGKRVDCVGTERRKKVKRISPKTWTGSQESNLGHATFEATDACTFEGVYEDFILPFITKHGLHGRTPFHCFLKEGIALLQGYLPREAEASTETNYPLPTLDLLPCGVPYKRNPIFLGLPLDLRGLSGARRTRRLKVLRRQAWLNQIVCCLSWVFMGRPLGGAKASVMCCQLNQVQEHAVCWLSSWTRMQAPPGHRISVDLPRGRGLRGLVLDLAGLGDYGRTNITHPAGVAECGESATVAHPIDVSLSAEEKDVLSLPRLCMRTPDWIELARALTSIGLCVLAEDSKSPLWGSQQRHLRAGVFGVEKPGSDRLRLIIDRRRKNATEQGLRKGLLQVHELGLVEADRFACLMRHMTLPHASQFTDLLLPRRCHFLMNLMDCKDFFYLLRMPLAATWSTPVGLPVPRARFRDLDLAADSVHCNLDEDTTCTLFLRAPAMGDLKSVEIAQAAHSATLIRGGMTDRQWLSFQSAPPADRLWQGCYVDDYFQGIAVPAPNYEEMKEARAKLVALSDSRLQATCREYDKAEFVIKHSKSQLQRTHAVVWGGEIQSEQGWVAGSREKMRRLLLATKRLLEQRSCWVPVILIERLIGHWVHQLTFQRLGMSLISDLYRLLHGRRLGQKRVKLSKGAQDELLILLSLWPLFTCDLRRPPARVITATDATTQRGGVVMGPLVAEEATWIWARLPRRPGATSWLSPEGVLEMASRSAPDVLLEEFINSQKLTVALNFKFRYEQHINIQEAVAVRSALKLLTRRVDLHSCRLPILVDSLVVQSVMARGRSCSRTLNKVVRSIAMLTLMSNVQLLTGWVRSESNPADDPTRFAPLRVPVPRSRDLDRDIQQVGSTWAFQATLHMWHELGWDGRVATKLFDDTLGFPGEGPRLSWPGQEQDTRMADLRVRVQPATVKRYGTQLQAFQSWAVTNVLGKEDDILTMSPDALCSALCAYVQYQYVTGLPFQHGLDLLAGVQMLRPEVSLAIRPAWQMQRQWSRLTPVGTRPPMPEQIMLALAAAAWTIGLQRVSAVIILMYHCLLRPNEAASCQRSQLLLPEDICPGSREAAIALPQTKTADRGARLQSVSIDDDSMAEFLSRIFGSDPPHRGLIAGGSKGLQMFFERVRRSVGLESSPWTLATLRGGGALSYLRKSGGNIIWLQFRGRWESARSMRHYIQGGLAMQAYAGLPQSTKDRIAVLAELAPSLLMSSEHLVEGKWE
eukprot:6345207-Amphidinium_carterae.3